MLKSKGDGGRKWRATIWTMAALAGGVAAGSLFRSNPHHPALAAIGGAGTLWMNSLRMIALPLAITNTIYAMLRDRSAKAAERIGAAMGVYLILLLLGAVLVISVLPSVLRATAVDHEAISALSQGAHAGARKAADPSKPAPTIGDMLVGFIPKNILQAAVNEEFLPLLVCAILFGLALRRVDPEKGQPVTRLVEGLTEAMMVLVRWIISCAPVGIFGLAAVFAANSGARIVGVLGRFVLYECSLMLVMIGLMYPIATLAGGVSLRRFASAAAGPQMVALSTRSSIAALPALLAAGEEMLPDNPEPSRALLPLAVSMFKVNRTTSGLCRLLVMLYFWGVPADPTKIFTFLASVVLLSFSDLGLPGGTNFRTVPAYLAAGCPIEAIVLLEVFEPFSDICKTVLNVTGDLSIAAIVSQWTQSRTPDRAMVAEASQAS
jgi:proton glutamate symport protein